MGVGSHDVMTQRVGVNIIEQEDMPPPKEPKFKIEDMDEEIPHYTLELYRHTMLRGANMGSLIALLGTPPVQYFRGVRQTRELMYSTAKASLYGALIGSACSAVLTYAITRNNTEDQIFDRAYRLRYNKGQTHMDLVTYGVVGSGAIAGAVGSPVKGTGALLGSAMGFGLAVLVHMATKGKD